MNATKNIKRMLVSEMKPGQLFAFSKDSLAHSVIWQKKGTRTISRINKNTKEILATYYFTKDDFGYYID